MTKIEELLQKYEAYVVYDEESASMKATITVKNGQTIPVINGRKLMPGTYTFWYENEQSLTTKLALIQKYHLKGSGSWSLGQEPENTWDYYAQVVKGEDNFYDVADTYWAKDAIQWAKEKDWVKGRREHYFEPEGTLTRAEFATLITRIMGIHYTGTYDLCDDISQHWARESINAVNQQRWMIGYDDGNFLPDRPITREEVVKVLACLLGEETEVGEVACFSDVAKSRWSYGYIQKMSAKGMVKGYEDGTFQPQKKMKRAEIVTILQRMFD